LIARFSANYVQLVDTNNVVIKQWSYLPCNTGYSCYLTEGGDLWRTAIVTNNTFQTAAAHGRLQKIGWDGTLLFDYTISDETQCHHLHRKSYHQQRLYRNGHRTGEHFPTTNGRRGR
jgi:hypothetical protein